MVATKLFSLKRDYIWWKYPDTSCAIRYMGGHGPYCKGLLNMLLDNFSRRKTALNQFFQGEAAAVATAILGKSSSHKRSSSLDTAVADRG
ncbi:MAG: hypothetical protein ACI8RU_002466 [Zhongshania aliphaticivorans]|jgi:hypothetical protein